MSMLLLCEGGECALPANVDFENPIPTPEQRK
jgi:hypothetical protein